MPRLYHRRLSNERPPKNRGSVAERVRYLEGVEAGLALVTVRVDRGAVLARFKQVARQLEQRVQRGDVAVQERRAHAGISSPVSSEAVTRSA